MQSEARIIFTIFFLFFSSLVFSAEEINDKVEKAHSKASEIIPAPEKVIVNPTAADKEIKKRLSNILQSTNWFEKINIKVENGIVFLNGEARTESHQQWAEAIANKTQDVVAVVNNIRIVSSSSWYISELKANLNKEWERFIYNLPYLALSIVILIVFWFFSRLTVFFTKKSLLARDLHPLLASLLARGFAILGYLIGLFIVLKVLGLTTIALSILGGTGILGIIIGIAFRDITENLLASVLLSIQSPFRNEDLIEIDGITGYVQALTIRATVLLTRDGHEVQIPNSTVYKSNIYNFSSTPNWREQFIIGIGYEDSISKAQEVALTILQKHPAVLNEPEPWILVDDLSVYTVNLRIYFWFDGSKYNCHKVRSSVIRLVKRAFQDAGISMPGQVVELHLANDNAIGISEGDSKLSNKSKNENESSQVSTDAEAGLGSDKDKIQEQGKTIRDTEQDKNLLLQSSVISNKA